MDVPVQEAGRYVLSLRLNHAGVRADAVGGVPHQGDAAHGKRHVHILQNFARAHVYQLCAADHGLGRSPPLGRRGQRHRSLPQWCFAEFVNHPFSFLSIKMQSFIETQRLDCAALFPLFVINSMPYLGCLFNTFLFPGPANAHIQSAYPQGPPGCRDTPETGCSQAPPTRPEASRSPRTPPPP